MLPREATLLLPLRGHFRRIFQLLSDSVWKIGPYLKGFGRDESGRDEKVFIGFSRFFLVSQFSSLRAISCIYFIYF